jgi:hypothetical protein
MNYKPPHTIYRCQSFLSPGASQDRRSVGELLILKVLE